MIPAPPAVPCRGWLTVTLTVLHLLACGRSRLRPGNGAGPDAGSPARRLGPETPIKYRDSNGLLVDLKTSNELTDIFTCEADHLEVAVSNINST